VAKPWWWNAAPPSHRLRVAIFFLVVTLALLAFAIFNPGALFFSEWDRWTAIATMPLLIVFFVAEAIRAQNEEDNA
jgi:hypothetical protein